MAYNTILIKRRTSGPATAPSSLSGGELAFNEVNSTLYYGSNAGVIAIGGDGAFVNRTSDQTISGNKTFSGSTILSSTTFSTDSTLDFSGNVLTDIGAPVNDTDATTKLYVDTVASNASTGTESLSTEVYNTFVKLTDDRAVNLTGGLTVTSGINADTLDTTGNATVGGNLTVTGDLQVLGAVTSLETTTTVTSAFSITNEGSQTAFTVTQTGSQNVAEFYDDANIALAVVDGGNVGVGTSTPNEKLTVTGNISATGTIYGASGLEIGDGVTTLFVENGKVGINTEAPNEELTVVGTISATEDIFARNADFTGTLDVNGDITLGGTLYVTNAATFASTVSAAGALTVEGTTTLNDDLTVTDSITVNSSTDANNIIIDGTAHTISFYDNVTVGGPLTDYKLTGVAAAGNGFTIETDSDSGAGINFTPFTGSHTNVTQGNLNMLTGDLSGNGSNYIRDFIIDGGTF